MSQTNIEYFNSTLKLFVNNINKFYPEYKEILDEYYNELLENDSSNDDKYVKRFMRKFGEYKDLISAKDNSLFGETICFLKNIDFKEIWDNEKTDDSIKNTIWDYLQTLFLIGETIICDSDKIKSLVESLKNKRDNESLDENITDENKELFDMLKNLSDKKNQPEINEDIFSNGLIGNLAKELSGDINLDELNLNLGGGDDGDGVSNIGDIFGKLMSGDNPMKFMNLIQNVGKKIQTKLEDGNLDKSKLLDEAQNMMGMLGNNNPLFDNLLNKAKKEMVPDKSSQSSYDNPTKERLRKKLEGRKNK